MWVRLPVTVVIVSRNDRLFLHGAGLINKYGQPELTGQPSFVEQAEDATLHFTDALRDLARIVPPDLR